MRRFHRRVMLAALLALAPMLTACESFDPDKLDVFHLNEKKKLPGERRPLFPEGVPGVTQGIPPEYMKGHTAEQPGAAINAATTPPAAGEPAKQTAAAQPAEPQKPKAKPKPKPKPRQAARKPTQVTVQPSSAGQAQPAPAAQQPAATAWPEPAQQAPQQEQSPWPATQQSAPAPWPSAPPPGTFSKQ